MLVGPHQKEESFTILEDVLCASSKSCKAACSEVWTEGKEKLVRLPEVQPSAFQSYAVWAYSGKVEVDTDRYPLPRSQQALLLNACIIRDVLDDVKFRNEVTRMLFHNIAAFGKLPDAHMLRYV